MLTVSERARPGQSFLRNVLQTLARWDVGCFAWFNMLFVKQLPAGITRHTVSLTAVAAGFFFGVVRAASERVVL